MIENIALGLLMATSISMLVLSLLMMSTVVHDMWADFQNWRWKRKMERESAKLPMGVLEKLMRDRQAALLDEDRKT